MGFFSTKKTYVSSVAYNLAGDVTQRQNYLKSLIASHVVTGDNTPLVDTITKGLIQGPAGNLRSFYRWASYNFNDIGLPVGGFAGLGSPDYQAAGDFIGLRDDGEDVKIFACYVDIADYTWWAERWMLDNHRAAFTSNWMSDIDENGLITVTFEDGHTESFGAAGFDKSKHYLYIVHGGYTLKTNSQRNITIYAFGSGNAELDAIIEAGLEIHSDYYPIIPVRLNNKFVSDVSQTNYQLSKKAFKKATGGNYDDLISKVQDNPSLGDIDYAYVVFGASLNTKDSYSKRYIYEFFSYLMTHQQTTSAEYLAYQAAYGDYSASYATWQAAQSNPADPLYNTDPPDLPPAPFLRESMVRVATNKAWGLNYDIQISWKGISEETGSGLRKADAKPGDVWFELGDIDTFSTPIMSGVTMTQDVERATLNWQVDDDSWRCLHIYGLVHRNFIYQGKYVETTLHDAINDTDESGFIIPLHNGALNALPSTIATEFASACNYIVFNCYKVVKKKWYETGLFKLVIIAVIIALVIIFPPAGGAGAGVLGSAAAVGAAIGLSGLAAIIAGTILNMVAAMIITAVIEKVSVAVFGDKIGAIIGAVASMVAIAVGTGLANGMSMSGAWAGLMSAPSLISLTEAAGSGIAGYVQASAQQTIAKTDALNQEFQKESQQISDLIAQNLGTDMGSINTLGLTDVSVGNLAESPSTFFARTLMTGSDIAEISMNMLTNFADLTLNTELKLSN